MTMERRLPSNACPRGRLFVARVLAAVVAVFMLAVPAHSEDAEKESAMTVYDFSAKRLDGSVQPLSDYRGQVLLIVNTASECGFTPQYEGLQKLHDELHARGFSVLGFPCNQFGGQEPGSDEQIASFCKLNYGVTFPMFSKIEVNGDGTHPLYVYLKSSGKGVLGSEGIKWNFTKFLIGRDGKTIKRYAPNDKPEKIKADIEKLLVP